MFTNLTLGGTTNNMGVIVSNAKKNENSPIMGATFDQFAGTGWTGPSLITCSDSIIMKNVEVLKYQYFGDSRRISVKIRQHSWSVEFGY